MRRVLATIVFFFFLSHPTFTLAQTNSLLGDADGNGKVDGVDYVIWLNNYGKSVVGTSKGDFDESGKVDGVDYVIWLNNYGRLSLPTSAEWSQFGGNAQNTNYTPYTVPTPWKYKWQWNGAGADGKKQANHLSVPDLIQPITGGGRVYMVAEDRVYALNRNTGQVIWSRGGIGTLLATPAYWNENIYVPSVNGKVYRINAATGAIAASFSVSGAFNNAITIVGDVLYVGNSSGVFYAINANSMNKIWEYQASSPIVTPAAYSSTTNRVVVNSQDLYVHAINASNGSAVWRVKPTQRNYQSGVPNSSGAQFDEGWPVIADGHNLVFVRYRLDWNSLWTWNPYPNTNSQIKSNLANNPNQQALFALNIDTGKVAFIPAVGNGGKGDGDNLPMGTQPVVKSGNGQEVAYVIWRNGLTCVNAGWCDGREDATMGEMVLDNNTVSGYSAGDVRFVKFSDIQTDEMMNVSMSGDILFHSHWLINAAEKITNRSADLGATFANPIKTTDAPFVIWRQVYCPPDNTQCNPQNFPGGSGTSYGPSNCPFNASTRYCSAGLYSYGDQRAYPPGFYEYHNDSQSGSNPYTIVSDNLVLVKTNDGGLIALESGNPTANAPQTPQVAGTAVDKADTIPVKPTKISPFEGMKYVGRYVEVTGTFDKIESHQPKAIYMSFYNLEFNSPSNLLVRIFEKDLNKFNIDFSSLKNRKVVVRGTVSLYWPYNQSPEIILTDPSQIIIE